MRIFPSIIQHGQSQQSIQQIQMIQIPAFLHKKPSAEGFETEVNRNHNNTNGTLQTSPIRQTEYHFQKQLKQCRICLQNSVQNQKLLVKLCKCSGSIEFIHEACFIQWVQKSLLVKNRQQRNKILRKKQIQCQMCKENISVRFQEERNLGKCQNIQKKIKSRPKLFGLILFLSVVTFVILIYLIARLSVQGVHLQRDSGKFFESLLMVCSIVLLAVLNLISVFFLAEDFIFSSSLRVKLDSKIGQQLQTNRKRPYNKRKKHSQSMVSYQVNPQSPLHVGATRKTSMSPQPIERMIQVSVKPQGGNNRYQKSTNADHLSLINSISTVNYRQSLNGIQKTNAQNSKSYIESPNIQIKNQRRSINQLSINQNCRNGALRLSPNLQQVLIEHQIIQEVIS